MTTPSLQQPDVKIGDWLREGWEVFASDIGVFLLASVIFNVLNGLCLAGLVLYGPLTCGMYLIIFDRMKGGSAEINRLFAGFDYFGNAFLAGFIFFLSSIVAGIIVVLGYSCIIGSLLGIALLIVLQTIFLFTFQIIALRGVTATEAIAISYNKIAENWGSFLLFGLIISLINMAGYTVMLGWLVTTPLTFAASAVAYRDVFGLDETPTEKELAGV